MSNCGCSRDEVVWSEHGTVSAIVCTVCSSIALNVGNVIVRMPCHEFPSLVSTLSNLRLRLEDVDDRVFLSLQGTGVTLAWDEEDLASFARVAEELFLDPRFCASAGVGPMPTSAFVPASRETH